jgi:hypothetical protein
VKVPLPGRGYWAKKAHGRSVPQTPLLKATDVRPIAHLKSPEARDPLATVAESPEFVRIAQVESRIQSFSTSGDKLHPAVLRAKKVLSKSDPDERYILRMAEPDCLDIRVSEGTLERALAIMNTLICMAESEGFRVVADSEQRETMDFCAYDERVEFSLTEKVHQVELESPRPPEKLHGGRYPTYAGKPIDYEPTGELCIEVRNYWSGGLRKTWRDSQKRRLEDLLSECLIGLLKIALVTHREMEQRRHKEIARQKKREEMLELQN